MASIGLVDDDAFVRAYRLPDARATEFVCSIRWQRLSLPVLGMTELL